MATKRHEPDLVGQKMAVGAWHRSSLEHAFGLPKPVSHFFYNPNITTLLRKINVIWVRPGLMFRNESKNGRLVLGQFLLV